MGTKIDLRGEVDTMTKSFTRPGIGIVFAILLVYLLMAVNFQSWLDPLIILMAIPGAFTGILWMLYITQTTFNVPSLMGTIMTIGVATANSILMVVFANDERIAGKDRREAALNAGFTRLRPVIMTALAMIIGMLPMALALGEGGEQNAPLGRAVIGGLLFATVGTLFIVPVIYSLLKKGSAQEFRRRDRRVRPRSPPRNGRRSTRMITSAFAAIPFAVTPFFVIPFFVVPEGNLLLSLAFAFARTPGAPSLMPDQTPPDHRLPDHRLSDGREDLGQSLSEDAQARRESQTLGRDFAQRNATDAPVLGRAFADPTYADRHALGSAFADPNSIDDTRLGNAFEQTQSSAKHHHRPIKEVVEQPFRKARSNGVLAWFLIAVVVVFLLVLFLGWLPRHHRKNETEQTAKQNDEAPAGRRRHRRARQGFGRPHRSRHHHPHSKKPTFTPAPAAICAHATSTSATTCTRASCSP